jgi:formate-dependent nitrite reductase membrane component NrfD
MLVTLGRFARPLITGGWGVLFWIGVIGIGLLFPLLLPYLRSGAFTRRPALGATCVLAGGLLLRFVVIMAPQWPHIALWKL